MSVYRNGSVTVYVVMVTRLEPPVVRVYSTQQRATEFCDAFNAAHPPPSKQRAFWEEWAVDAWDGRDTLAALEAAGKGEGAGK